MHGMRESMGSRAELGSNGVDPPPSAGNGDSLMVRAAIARAQAGNMQALNLLYLRHADEILRFVKSMVRDHHEAEDITQNVFIKLMRVIGKYEPRDVPFSAWIRKVARNVALDHLRARRMTLFEDIQVADDDCRLASRERNRDLCEALDRLTEDQREVLILRHIIGLSPAEIARLLGKKENAIHALHHRGRLSLQSALTELGAAPVVARS
jgi:RNA polymerase sigma-70 factor (ECF subfamily)